jgi:Transposase DNA-binding/Transposase Tn5 dimerisation domain
MDWIIEELAMLSLGDKRLNKRAHKLLGQLSRNPTDSIPAACSGAGETKAAYRFFDNEQVSYEKIQHAHFEATLARMSQHSVVLIPQDTTVLNFSTQYNRADAGPTTKGSTNGIHLHSAIAITPEKICLGHLSSKQWYRKELQNLIRQERTKKNYSTPIEEKESYRWLENYNKANEYARNLPNTKIVSIADREGDIYNIYEEAQKIFTREGAKAHYLIRARTDRKVCTEEGKATEYRIRSSLKSEKALGEFTLELSETKKRKSRMANLTIYSKKIHISLPDKQKREKDYKPVEVTAILCIELDPPMEAEAIEWLLLTDLFVNSFEEAYEKIQWYTCRWQIEIFFKVLKSGCTIEKLQLTEKNFSAALSFYMIIAWRILYVVAVGRHCPEVSCECVFSKEEWQTTYVVVYRKKPPETPPTLNEMTRMVASLGGYINRKSNPEPGVKTMWIGLRNMQEHLKAKEAFEAVYGPTCG